MTGIPSEYVFALIRAARSQAGRDALWKAPPPLADDCEHDFGALPVVEFRQTVLCGRCGGLSQELSRELEASPEAFTIREDGRISRKFEIRRRDPAEAAELIRAGYEAAGIPADIAEAMIEGITGE